MDNKEYLKRNIQSKIRTTMIGALESFENRFGKLWGHHKGKDGPFTEQEERFYQLWLEVREEILDKGNAQIGGANKEINSYNIEKERYHYKFINRRTDGRD